MPVVKRIDIMSLAKIFTLFGVVVGLVLGIFYGVIATLMGIRHGLAPWVQLPGSPLLLSCRFLVGCLDVSLE